MLQEAVNINQSLFVLRRVITALSRNADEHLGGNGCSMVQSRQTMGCTEAVVVSKACAIPGVEAAPQLRQGVWEEPKNRRTRDFP